ncbi:MAG: integral rane sensor signal transduction histidine kinase [Clostridia bacterium]|nr:integral rane sensor signal transduction histidine kinase [Clostridia bacterium]
MNIKNRLKNINVSEMVVIYRYISLMITSYFYVVTINQHSLSRKSLIISGMTITSIIMSYLYAQNKGEVQKIRLLIFVETLGNSLLLILSGGAQSPYVWYVFNTVFVAAIEIESYLSWINMFVYMGSIIFTRSLLLLSDINAVLGIILMTAGVQIFVNYARQIEEKNNEIMYFNEQLKKSNARVEETLEYVVKIYEAIHLFSNQNNRQSLIELILDYTSQVLDMKGALFIRLENQNQAYSIYSKGIDKSLEREIGEEVVKMYRAQKHHSKSWQLETHNILLTAININYSYTSFGILVIKSKDDLKKMDFIVQLSGMLFQQFNLEEMNDTLIVEQEQNRIANEIHDNVLQKLFAVSCNLFAISKSIEEKEKMQIINELNTNRNSINHAMTELRKTIYGLSSDKGGTNSLRDKIDSYIQEMQDLHNIKIVLEVKGDCRQLTTKEQTSLYRIICEGTANGIKHGKASLIEITLCINYREIQVSIKDNGIGFNLQEAKKKEAMGLGIRNMQYLAALMGGYMTINSNTSQGTILEMNVWNREPDYLRKEIV